MRDKILDKRKIVSLRIEVDPFPENARDVRFTTVDSRGESLSAPVIFHTGDLENLCDVLGRIAEKTAPAEGGLPFGELEGGVRVILGVDGYTAPNFIFYCTFAYPSGDGAYAPTTGRARVSDASLARLGVRARSALSLSACAR